MALQCAVKPSRRLVEQCYPILNPRLLSWSGTSQKRCALVSAQLIPLSTRPFTSSSSPSLSFAGRHSDPSTSRTLKHQKHQSTRPLSTSTKWSATPQEAHGSSITASYIASAGELELVNVKKVLVIGSGGLSIGQAGEFDYSGMRISVMTHSSIC